MTARRASNASPLLCALAFLAGGCASTPPGALEGETNSLREAAIAAFESGDSRTALAINTRAIAMARGLPATSWLTVENYDDAGWYFYGAGDWERSARHQAIAVLLACGTAENAPMFPTYLERLGWAFAKHRPGRDFRPIAENPLVLLDDPSLGLRDNADVRRRYYIAYPAPPTSRSSRQTYVLKLRSGARTPCF